MSAEAQRLVSTRAASETRPVTVVDRIARLRKELDAARAGGRTVGLVPTMGYLHDGHRSLMAAARRDCDVVASTIFVNPLQFGADEDLASYPRDLDRDRALAEAAGVDVLFVPSTEAMYPDRVLTSVEVAFNDLGLREIVAFTLPDNLASRRVMEKAGFVYDREVTHVGLPHVLYVARPPSG